MAETNPPFKPCIIVHGGAGIITLGKRNPTLCAVKEAVKSGYQVLEKGGSSLDAVEVATRKMEDSGVLNAGCGAYLTEEGTVELDAMIMDGQTLNTGAVACVQNISNPISLARKVMTDTSHCMLAGDGALKFARNIGFPILKDPSALISDYSYQRDIQEKFKQENQNIVVSSKSVTTAVGDVPIKKYRDTNLEGHDTVGAVAIDTNGCIAVTSSTGGIPHQMCGRIGDSPLVGSGSYANQWAGASCTGHGESLLKVVLSREVVHCVENGDTPTEACRRTISKLKELTGGNGGVICLDKSGKVGLAFNTKHMLWASLTEGILKCGIDPGEEIKEEV